MKKEELKELLADAVVDNNNISEEDIVRIFGQAEAEQQTEYEVNGNTIKFLTDVTTDGDVIKFETDSTFVYKDNIYL